MPFPSIAWDPTNPNLIGERPGFPTIDSSPGGGSTVKRELTCLQSHVYSWMVYFSSVAPIDPYTLNSNLWTMGQVPYERQYRTQGAVGIYGPAYAIYPLAVLKLGYESQGMRFYPGQGVVKEEMKPRSEQEPTGVVRTYGAQGPAKDQNQGATLTWASSDGNTNSTNSVYYSEHPHFESGGSEFIMTIPFAPTQNEPLRPGMTNLNAWTSLAINYTFPAGTLKYIGMGSEASVAIPAIGIYTGLQRWRKSFLFHYRNPAVNTAAQSNANIDWNTRYRARDQKWLTMLDANAITYKQYPPYDFASVNFFI